MITSYGRFYFPGSTWNFYAIIWIFENSVKLNSSSDYLFDDNVPFGAENKVQRSLSILHKQEDLTYYKFSNTNVGSTERELINSFENKIYTFLYTFNNQFPSPITLHHLI